MTLIATPPSEGSVAVLDIGDVFDVIREVETGGHPNPSEAVGDGGKSIGPYQISRAYYQDSIDHDGSLVGIEYASMRDKHMAEVIMIAYFERWVPTPWTLEMLCRTHNGGPKGRFRDSTLPYWEKCLEALGTR